MPPPLLALTGGTGFLGARISDLASVRGWQVRALVRGEGRAVPGAAELINGDLQDAAALRRLVNGADYVIHNAGAVRARSAEGFMGVNRDGAAAVADAVAEAAPRDARMLLVSSLAATRPDVSPYAASKAGAEAAVRERCADRLFSIVRPPAIYGPDDAATKPLFDAMRLGFAPVLGDPGSRFAMVYVDDAAEACLAAVAAADQTGRVFSFDDGGGGYDWAALRGAAEASTGRKLRAIRIHPWLLRIAGGCGSLVGQLGLATPFLTSGKVREMLAGDWLVDAKDAPPDWSPATSLHLGFSRTLAWYRGARQ